MKKFFLFFAAWLSLFAANAATPDFSKGDYISIGGELTYGDDLDVILGSGEKVDPAIASIHYDKSHDVFSIDIYDLRDANNPIRIFEDFAHFSDISLNIDKETGWFRGIVVKSEKNKYQIFRASEHFGPEIRISNSGDMSFIFSLGCTMLYNSSDMANPIYEDCNNVLWGPYDADSDFNDWLSYIRSLVK